MAARSYEYVEGIEALALDWFPSLDVTLGALRRTSVRWQRSELVVCSFVARFDEIYPMGQELMAVRRLVARFRQ